MRGCPLFATKVIPALVNACGAVDLDPEWAAAADAFEQDDTEVSVVAETSLDRISQALGGRYLLPIVGPIIGAALQCAEPGPRVAALTTVAAVAEGCADEMNSVLDSLVASTVPCLLNPHPRVRYTACNAVGQLCSDFADDDVDGFLTRFAAQIMLAYRKGCTV